MLDFALFVVVYSVVCQGHPSKYANLLWIRRVYMCSEHVFLLVLF